MEERIEVVFEVITEGKLVPLTASVYTIRERHTYFAEWVHFAGSSFELNIMDSIIIEKIVYPGGTKWINRDNGHSNPVIDALGSAILLLTASKLN